LGNIIDIILLVLLSLFALRGYFKGLFRESFSLLGLFIGFMVAVSYVNPIIVLFGSYWKFSPIILKAIVFVLLLFLVYFVFNPATESYNLSLGMHDRKDEPVKKLFPVLLLSSIT